jgi:hypothetical protein
MSLKSEILADVHSPSLPVNKIHPMIKRAVQIAEGFDPGVAANLPAGTDTIQEAIDALAARESIATGSLTAAQVIAATTPHTILAAPATGKINIIKKIELFLDYAAAFTSGSDIAFEYATTGTDIAVIDVASITGTADLAMLVTPTGYAAAAGSAAFSATANAAKAINLLVTGAAFADGAGTVLKYRITYETVTLLT